MAVPSVDFNARIGGRHELLKTDRPRKTDVVKVVGLSSSGWEANCIIEIVES